MSDDVLLPDLPTPEAWVGWTTRQQAIASDPDKSVWVSANAGSGKTHVLTQRVMRLLLAGVRPSAILCLTYTKAAASEMSNRVFQRLSQWATISDVVLSEQLRELEYHEPDSARMAEARRLFARALETPGGLKIQTIHAFCEALLHQFPLEANVAGHFSVLDDRSAAALLADARRNLLSATSAERDRKLAGAFADVLILADDTGLETLLQSVVQNRNALRRFLKEARRTDGPEAHLRRGLGLAPDETVQTIARMVWPMPGLFGPMLDAYLETADRLGGSKAVASAEKLRKAIAAEDPELKLGLLSDLFLTQAGAPRAESGLFSKKMAEAAPGLDRAVLEARDHVIAVIDRQRTARMLDATLSALVLAERLDSDYEALKQQRAFLDFEDLIVRTADLLTRSDAAAWVHYKLDQGIDHILVDEAQDTSPDQWRIVNALTGDFFSGQSARALRRTLFVVGDEKQSIYSFQGARPERFSRERQALQKRIPDPDQFSYIRLPLSFRSTESVLSAVDQVFSLADNARGLNSDGGTVQHQSSRIGHPGQVDIWEMIAAEQNPAEEDWTAPFDRTPESAPAAILARRISHHIEELIRTGTVIEKNRRRAITAGDILVLVRKRDGFVNALNRTLKQRYGIPVAGADRLRLTNHIAVQDLIALGRFMVLPADDLSLAAILKSPLLDLSEDDLFEIAALRPRHMTVWQHLQTLAEQRPHFADAIRKLDAFRSFAKRMTVHDFYARILGPLGGRRQFLARLGSEVSDILDEFASFALAHEESGLPGLSAFLATLETEAPEVKREQDKGRGEVRIMTVHAAKGLEAPVVFLVDGGSRPFESQHLPKFRLVERGGLLLPLWVPGKAVENSITMGDAERLRQAGEEEYRRLLYVGMTRAADQLIICGYRGMRAVPDSWHNLVRSAFEAANGHLEPRCFESPQERWNGWRWMVKDRIGKTFETWQDDKTDSVSNLLPDALSTPLPPDPWLPRPLSPSEAGVIVEDEAEDLRVTSPLFSEGTKAGRAAERGRLTHRMLQILPEFPVNERRSAAQRYLSRAARFWTEEERRVQLDSVMRLLEDPAYAPLFAEASRSEVAIMGTLRLGSREYAISGRIDRLVISAQEVLVVDYKTNRSPPTDQQSIPLAHRAQMAIYREILKPLYPGRRIRACLVYTHSGTVLALEEGVLDNSLAEITPK